MCECLPVGLGSHQGRKLLLTIPTTAHSFLAPFKECRREQTHRDTCGHRHTQTDTHTCNAESDDVDFEIGPVDQVLQVGETPFMLALAMCCQDKITEALYPIEQLITESQVGQPGWTGGERTATPLCSGQGSTLAPSLCREQPRRKWQKPSTEECVNRLRTSTTVQTRIRTPRCPILPAYDAGRHGP